jgi:SAM-dependent methyltransferase
VARDDYGFDGTPWEQVGWRSLEDAHQRFSPILQVVRGGDRVIDLGAGTGLLHGYLAQQGVAPVDYVPVERSATQLERLRANLPPGTRAHQSDVGKAPLGLHGDVIAAFGVACDLPPGEGQWAALRALLVSALPFARRALVIDFWDAEKFAPAEPRPTSWDVARLKRLLAPFGASWVNTRPDNIAAILPGIAAQEKIVMSCCREDRAKRAVKLAKLATEVEVRAARESNPVRAARLRETVKRADNVAREILGTETAESPQEEKFIEVVLKEVAKIRSVKPGDRDLVRKIVRDRLRAGLPATADNHELVGIAAREVARH